MDVPKTERFKVQLFLCDDEVIKFYKNTPTRSRSLGLNQLLKRGLGVSDSEIQSMRDLATDLHSRISDLEVHEVLTADYVTRLNEHIHMLESLVVSLVTRVEDLELKLTPQEETPNDPDDQSTAHVPD